MNCGKCDAGGDRIFLRMAPRGSLYWECVECGAYLTDFGTLIEDLPPRDYEDLDAIRKKSDMFMRGWAIDSMIRSIKRGY